MKFRLTRAIYITALVASLVVASGAGQKFGGGH
jgi:hypothetical protein